MIRPDKGRKRTWRFRLNEDTILEVSAPEGPTEKQVRRRGRVSLVFGTLLAAVMLAAVASASDVDTSVVDTTAPTGSISLAPGGEGAIQIKLTVTGRQANPATVKIYSTWTLTDGSFSGADEESVAIAARAATDPPSVYSLAGTVKLAAGHTAGGPHSLAIKPHSVTTTAPAALDIGDASNYLVTVVAPADTTPPVISYALNPPSPDGDAGWYRSDVTLTWTVSEPETPGSLVKTGCVDQNIATDQAATTYSCSATSTGGSAGLVDVTIKRDGTAPMVSVVSVKNDDSSTYTPGTWTNQDVTVDFECSDATSGVASLTPDPVTLGEGENQQATTTCMDNAGNTANRSIDDIDVDKTKPVVAVTGVIDGATYTLGSVPVAGCNTTDALSGVKAAATLGVSGGPVGSITTTCSGAEDNAGNTNSASATYTVIYDWNGFFSPVENPSAWNSAKAGQAVPLKFSLGGNQGLTVLAAGYPKVVALVCPTTAQVDPIEEYATEAANSKLIYDAEADQYNYVWKTDKAWAGKCFRVDVKLNDTTTHSAYFKFTK